MIFTKTSHPLLITAAALALVVLVSAPAFAEKNKQRKISSRIRMQVYPWKKTVSVEVNGRYAFLNKEKKITKAGYRLNGSKLTVRLNKFYLNHRYIGDDKIVLRGMRGALIFLNGAPYAQEIEFRIKKPGVFTAINCVNLEAYLKGVLAGEVLPNTSHEALKAQAVISRTCAIYSMLNPRGASFHVAKRFPQNYKAKESYEDTFKKALKDTEGEIVYYKGRIMPAYFCTVCGGKTDDGALVWDIDQELPRGVECPYCRKAKNYFWGYETTAGKLRRMLLKNGYKVGDLISIVPKSKNSSSRRVSKLVIKHTKGVISIDSAWLRKKLGPNNLKSTIFDVAINGDIVRFTGRGWGHGVGLCQEGAAKMASTGKNYQEILKFYYPGSEVRKILKSKK
ncbi:SpoIID/LytB domain-containing protein [Candidatus Auribacterota bacterium]